MKPPPYHKRLDAMVAKLRAHPQIEIYEYTVRAPARDVELRELEAISKGWETDSHVNEISDEQREHVFGPGTPEPPFGAACIDNFSKYNHADLLIGPEPVVIVSSDHGADMEASDWCSFSVYFDLLIAIYATNRYENGIGIGWTRQPQWLEAWTKQAKLDDLIAKLVEEA